VLPYHEEAREAWRAARVWRWRMLVAGLLLLAVVILIQ
jgi:hypothetical protein